MQPLANQNVENSLEYIYDIFTDLEELVPNQLHPKGALFKCQLQKGVESSTQQMEMVEFIGVLDDEVKIIKQPSSLAFHSPLQLHLDICPKCMFGKCLMVSQTQWRCFGLPVQMCHEVMTGQSVIVC